MLKSHWGALPIQNSMSQSLRLTDTFLRVSLLSILIAASILRLWSLGEDSLWYDEAVSWSQSRGSLDQLIQQTATDNYPPLHNLLLFIMMRVYGESEVALRFPSAFLGIANVAAVYWLGAILNNRFAGLLAALLLAFSEFHIWYSQEARMYTLMALCATLFAITSVRYLQESTNLRGFWLAVSGVALLYSHPFGMLIWSAISFAVLVIDLRSHHVKPTTWKFIIVQCLTGAAFLPWALILLPRAQLISQVGFWVPPPSFDFVVSQLTAIASGAQFFIFLCAGSLAALLLDDSTPPRLGAEAFSKRASTTELASTIGLLLTCLAGPSILGTRFAVLLVVPLVLAAKIACLPQSNARPFWSALQVNPTIILLIMWLVLPVLLGLLISIAWQPLFLSRYLIGVLPAWLLLASIGIMRFVRSRTDVSIVTMLVIGLGVISLQLKAGRHDWRAVGLFLSENKNPEDCVVVTHTRTTPLQYYYREPISCLITTRKPHKLNLSRISDKVWIINYYESRVGRDAILENFPTGQWKIDQKEFDGGIKLIVLTKAQPSVAR